MAGSADVDLLDTSLRTGARGHCRRERVKVADQQIKWLDAEFGQLRAMRFQPHISEQASVNIRVQGFDAAVEAFGEARDLLDSSDRETCPCDGRGRGPGRNDLHACLDQGTCHVDKVRLVIDRDQRAPDGPTALLKSVRRVGHVQSTFLSATRHVRVAS